MLRIEYCNAAQACVCVFRRSPFYFFARLHPFQVTLTTALKIKSIRMLRTRGVFSATKDVHRFVTGLCLSLRDVSPNRYSPVIPARSSYTLSCVKSLLILFTLSPFCYHHRYSRSYF